MIKIAIVEDDDLFASQLSDYLDRYSQEQNTAFKTRRFSDGYALVENYRHDFDIILMDIEMGLMDGMAASREIRKVDENVIIIFITNMAQYAIQGYAVSALDYVLKPVNYVAFSESLRKAITRLARRPDALIQITQKGSTARLRSSDIYWVESHGHHLTFHAASGDYDTTVYSLKDIEEKLKEHGFMRASSGSLVNLDKVSKIQGNTVIVNGQTIFISRGRKNEFVAALVSRMTE